MAGRDLEVLVLAGGAGERLGRGPKAFLRLNGQTLLERAVDLGRQLAPRVTIAVPADMLDDARRLADDRAQVVAGGPTRLATFSRLVHAARGRTLVLLDVVHPLTTRALGQRVLEAAGERAAAMAVGTVTDYLIDRNALVAAGPGEVGVLQKPIVFPREAALTGLGRLTSGTDGETAGRAPASVEIFRLGGIDVRLVEGEPWNVKITTEADWQLVLRLAAGVPPGAAPGAAET